MTFVASPVNHWHEDPTNGPALQLSALVPYKTTAGYWVLFPRGSQPAGATQGAWVAGSNNTLTTSTTVGLRHVKRSDGAVLSF